MATLLTPNEALTRTATVVQIGADTSVYIGPCRLVGAWIHHTTAALLAVYDSTSTASGLKFSIRGPATGMTAIDVSSPAGITFNVGIHANAAAGAAFVAYIPL